MLMADLGADVIKLETTTGDMMRHVERVFAGCQRGKRDIALDLKKPESREILERIVGWADVIHHNIRMPAAIKLGIDEPTLRKINPKMVYCHTSSYGPIGPRRIGLATTSCSSHHVAGNTKALVKATNRCGTDSE
jgi:crotonobetainyl-CoA:carnitine CoA-transferase CaiB-like acyl-CoA transferase